MSEAGTRVTLYGKPGCHLCDVALEVLMRVQADVPFELIKRDITTDDALYAQMAESIPVIEVNGQTFCKYRVNEARFRNKLREEV